MTIYFLKQKLKYVPIFSLVATGVFFLFSVTCMEEYAFGCEMFLALLLAILSCFILENRDEVELIHCTKHSVRGVFYTQLVILYGYVVLNVIAAQSLVHIWVPCERGTVPTLFLSFAVTGFFFIGVSGVARRLTGNVYVAIGITLFVTVFCLLLHNNVRDRVWDARWSFVDVYALETMYGVKYWIWNRLIMLAIGAVLFFIGYRYGGKKDED